MFVSQVRFVDAGANADLLDTLDWDGPDGLLNTLNKKVDKKVKWDASNKWNDDHGTREPIQLRYSEMPVIHDLNTSAAQKREALATLRVEESEGSDGGEEVVGGSMVGGGDGGGAMEGGGDGGGAMEGGAMVGGGDGGGAMDGGGALRQRGGYFPEMPVEHVNTSEAQRREAVAAHRADDIEGSDSGEEVVGGSMEGGAMVGGAMVGGAMYGGGGDGGGAMVGGSMVGGGDGGGSGGVRSEAPALAAVPRTTATIKQLQAMEELIKGKGVFAATLAEVRSGSGSFKPEDQDGFLKWMKCIDIQVNRPATLCKQCAIYSLHCVADSLGTACQRRVLVISI